MNSATKKMGFPVGLATLFDEVGVDVGAHIGEYLGGVYGDRMGNPEAMVNILKEFVANGLLGKPCQQQRCNPAILTFMFVFCPYFTVQL